MKNLDSILHTLDGIFRDLNRASNIIITMTNTGTSGRPVLISGDQKFSIDQVNGCHTPEEFYHSLVSLCAGVRLSTAVAMKTLDPSENEAFILQAFHRVNILLQITISVTLTAKEAALWTKGEQCIKQFKHGRLIFKEGNPELSPADLNHILLAAHAYSSKYSLALRILSFQLIYLLTRVEHKGELNPLKISDFNNPSHKARHSRYTEINEWRKHFQKLTILN